MSTGYVVREDWELSLFSALCALSKLNHRWLYNLIEPGNAKEIPQEKVHVKIWTQKDNDSPPVETKQLVWYKEAYDMKTKDGNEGNGARERWVNW